MRFRLLALICVVGIAVDPTLIKASATLCSSDGYTIGVINGINTTKDEAETNANSLAFFTGNTYRGQTLAIKYLYNPTHVSVIGDLIDSVDQGIFDNETIDDYDMEEILKSASEKVTTQKLLIVAHSQGNFYANSFYNLMAGQTGGVPRESFGVYSVASPSDHVAGGGKWLTSDSDTVISTVVGHVHNILKPNIHIDLQPGDDAQGHNFINAYLKHVATRIVTDVYDSLGKLKNNDTEPTNVKCIATRDAGVVHAVQTVAYAVVDPLASVGQTAIVGAVKGSVAVVQGATTVTQYLGVGMAKTGETALSDVAWAGKMTVAVGSATFNFIGNTTSTAFAYVGSMLSGGTQLASVSAATTSAPPLVLALSISPLPATPQLNISTAVATQNTTPTIVDHSKAIIDLQRQIADIQAQQAKLAADAERARLEQEAAYIRARNAALANSMVAITANAYHAGFGGGGGPGAGIPEAPPQSGSPEAVPQKQNSTSTAPTSLLASAGDTTVLLAWTAPASNGGVEISDYEIHESTDTFNLVDFILNDGVSTSTGSLITSLHNGTPYQFKVFAINSVGTSTASNIASSTPVAPAPVLLKPSAPTNVQNAVSVGSIDLAWDVPASDGGSPITDYIVQYSTSTDFSVQPEAHTGTDLFFTLTSLDNDTDYYIRIVAVSANGQGTASDLGPLHTPVDVSEGN